MAALYFIEIKKRPPTIVRTPLLLYTLNLQQSSINSNKTLTFFKINRKMTMDENKKEGAARHATPTQHNLTFWDYVISEVILCSTQIKQNARFLCEAA